MKYIVYLFELGCNCGESDLNKPKPTGIQFIEKLKFDLFFHHSLYDLWRFLVFNSLIT